MLILATNLLYSEKQIHSWQHGKPICVYTNGEEKMISEIWREMRSHTMCHHHEENPSTSAEQVTSGGEVQSILSRCKNCMHHRKIGKAYSTTTKYSQQQGGRLSHSFPCWE